MLLRGTGSLLPSCPCVCPCPRKLGCLQCLRWETLQLQAAWQAFKPYRQLPGHACPLWSCPYCSTCSLTRQKPLNCLNSFWKNTSLLTSSYIYSAFAPLLSYSHSTYAKKLPQECQGRVAQNQTATLGVCGQL